MNLVQHFKTAIDLIADAFFKHGEKGPLRSCIKAIIFCCTECQADLKDYAENKLKNLEDELVLKVRTAIKEVEVHIIHSIFSWTEVMRVIRYNCHYRQVMMNTPSWLIWSGFMNFSCQNLSRMIVYLRICTESLLILGIWIMRCEHFVFDD